MKLLYNTHTFTYRLQDGGGISIFLEENRLGCNYTINRTIKEETRYSCHTVETVKIDEDMYNKLLLEADYRAEFIETKYLKID